MTQMKARDGEEVWETTTDGRVWLTITDDRGRVSEKGIGGKAGSRIRIKTLDRQVNEDAVVMGNNPFESGMLIRVDEGAQEHPVNVLSDDQLKVVFAKSGMAFRSAVDKLNELNVRRMDAMATGLDATGSQVTYLKEVIRDRYRQEGDTETYRQLKG